MNKIKVKTEHYPIRCEICHQSDYFDFENLSCKRCNDLNIIEQNSNNNQTTQQQKEDFFKMMEKEVNARCVHSQENHKKYRMASYLMFFNVIVFIVSLILLNFSGHLLIFNIILVATGLLFLEFCTTFLFNKKSKLVSEGIKVSLVISFVVILLLFIIVLFSPHGPFWPHSAL
jgi:hypothetical protein